MSKRFPFYGDILEFSNDILNYNELRSNFVRLGEYYQYKMHEQMKENTERYKKDGDYERFIQKSIAQLGTVASRAVEFSVFTLMQYDIDTYDRERFSELFGDCNTSEFYENLGVWDPIETYFSVLDGISEAKDSLAEARMEERNGRSQYVNLFSSDVRSAVSGEISAGIMNAAQGAVRGFKDALQDSADKRKMKEAIDSIILDKSLQNDFTESSRFPFLVCCAKVASILWENQAMNCPYSDEMIKENDAALRKIKNYVEFGDKSKAVRLIKDYLQQDPHSVIIYKMMYTLCGDKNLDLIRLAKYFDVYYDYVDMLMDIADSEYLFDIDIDSQIADMKSKLAEYKRKNLI